MVKLSVSIAAMAAVVASVGAAPMSVFSSPERFADCVPGTTLKEYHTFYLESVKLQSLVSKKPEELVVVGGVPGNKDFQELEFCVVSSDYGCDNRIPSNCIYPDVEYRFRVNGPVKGYLKVNDNKELDIVENFGDASGLNLYREEGWGLRIAHRQEGDLPRIVFSTNGGGNAINLVEQVKNDARQWFEIRESDTKSVTRQWYETVEDHEDVVEQAGCLSSLRVYQAFRLYGYNFDTFIAKYPYSSMIMSSGNPPLVLCAAFGDFPCSLTPPRICVRENTDYYLRAELEDGKHGYIKVVGNYIRIIPDIKEASKFFLFGDQDQVQVGYRGGKNVVALTADKLALPVELREPNKGISQAFKIDTLKGQ